MAGHVNIKPDELFVDLLTAPRYRVLRHVSLIVMVAMLGITNVYTDLETGEWVWQVATAILVFIPILLNVYVFVPRILFRNRPYLYCLAAFFSVAAVLFIHSAFQYYHMFALSYIYNSDLGSVKKFILMTNLSAMISFSLVMAGTTALIILQSWLRDRKRIGEYETALAMTELDMLKSQINPHFLFNMLNNAIVLTREEPIEAQQVILSLKWMLNYQLEKSSAETIYLRDDINFLNELLQLEKVRRDRFDYHIVTTGDIADVKVAPLLFIPFVENAIKHGNDNVHSSYIELIFRVADGKLDFFCTNSVPATTVQERTGGLGLKNIKRRLELLYSGVHSLDIQATPKTYNVNLTIPI